MNTPSITDNLTALVGIPTLPTQFIDQLIDPVLKASHTNPGISKLIDAMKKREPGIVQRILGPDLDPLGLNDL